MRLWEQVTESAHGGVLSVDVSFHSLFVCSFVRSFVAKFVRSFVRFVAKFVRSFVAKFVRCEVRSFRSSFVRLLVPKFILWLGSRKEKCLRKEGRERMLRKWTESINEQSTSCACRGCLYAPSLVGWFAVCLLLLLLLSLLWSDLDDTIRHNVGAVRRSSLFWLLPLLCFVYSRWVCLDCTRSPVLVCPQLSQSFGCSLG